jgi:hypothetical protein
MKKVVLLICVLISIYSCNTKNKETDLEKLNLKGDVIFVEEDDGGKYTWEFDNNGNLIRTIKYYDFESVVILEETSFTRDGTDKLITEKEQSFFNYERQPLVPITKKYNYLNDKLSKITYQNKYGGDVSEKYKYENDNLVEIKEVFYSKDQDVRSSISTTNFFYNKKNNLDSTRQIAIYEDGTIASKNTKIYLPNGLLKSDEYLVSLREYKYNGNNDLVEEKITDLKKNEVTQLINYNYIYDNKNNWIEKTKIYNDSKDQNVVKRKIIYKGESYTEFIAKYDLFILKYKTISVELDGSSSQLEDESPSVSVFQSQENENQISNNTPQQKEKRKCYSCNGKGQCSKCSKPQRVRYKQGESPHDHNEIRQGMIVCHQCGGNLMDFGSDKNKSCYLCKASGWLNCRECNSNGNGNYIGKCQRCEGTGFDR